VGRGICKSSFINVPASLPFDLRGTDTVACRYFSLPKVLVSSGNVAILPPVATVA